MKHSNAIQVNTEPWIEVFRTNISEEGMADEIIKQLSFFAPELEANFDLDDCDKVLRVKSVQEPIDQQAVMRLVVSMGGQIDVLE